MMTKWAMTGVLPGMDIPAALSPTCPAGPKMGIPTSKPCAEKPLDLAKPQEVQQAQEVQGGTPKGTSCCKWGYCCWTYGWGDLGPAHLAGQAHC